MEEKPKTNDFKTYKGSFQEDLNTDPIEIDKGKIAVGLLALVILVAIILWLWNGAKKVQLVSKRSQLSKLKNEEIELEKSLKFLKEKKDELERQYDKAYRLLRIAAFTLWLVIQVILAITFCETKASEILGFLTDVNTYVLIIIGFLHYVRFGTLTNYLRYLVVFRTWIKNYVFRDYLHINQDIFDFDLRIRRTVNRQEKLREEIKQLEEDLGLTETPAQSKNETGN